MSWISISIHSHQRFKGSSYKFRRSIRPLQNLRYFQKTETEETTANSSCRTLVEAQNKLNNLSIIIMVIIFVIIIFGLFVIIIYILYIQYNNGNWIDMYLFTLLFKRNVEKRLSILNQLKDLTFLCVCLCVGFLFVFFVCLSVCVLVLSSVRIN